MWASTGKCRNHVFRNCFLISSPATVQPSIVPAANSHGEVPSMLSSAYPPVIPTSVGTNILHVVSAIVPINKMTVDVSFGGGGVPLDDPSDALMYTTYSTK